MRIKENYSLKEITTMHLPVTARYVVEYDSVDDLCEVLMSDVCRNNRVFQMGGGSNLVFSQPEYDGVILRSYIKGINVIDEDQEYACVEAASGETWDDFVKFCIEHGYYGVENLSGIPGQVGACAVQNIGSYGAEVKDVIASVVCVEKNTGEVEVFSNEQCQFGYRDSVFKRELKDKYVVTSVLFNLPKLKTLNLTYGPLQTLNAETATMNDVRSKILETRNAKLPDPAKMGSVGSFFKNPVVERAKYEELKVQYPSIPSYVVDDEHVKIPAGWLIENAGMKGYKLGGAAVYEKQCLVLVNTGDATSEDVVNLAAKVVNEVIEKFGIEISPEANIL